MRRIVAIGESERLRGFALAGVGVIPAEDPVRARAAWRALEPDVGLVILTQTARDALTPEDLGPATERLWVAMPA